jgi:4-amino-4-deoxy-L-arabinose transferase-like glycosyltransferase
MLIDSGKRNAGINPAARCPDDRLLIFLFAAISILVFLLPLTINFPLLDPDEGLHASIAQEMIESGDWVVPHFRGEAFLDKPILYFWCQALSLRSFGMNEFAVRLPGLFLGFLGCVTTGIVGRRMFGRTTGFVSAIFYATMLLPLALAQAAAHDVALVPCVNMAILLFWESDRATTWKSSTAFALAIGVFLGLAILAKGLVGVALVGVTYGSYLLITRQLTLAACYRGAISLAIAAAIASIWYLAVEQREPGFLEYYFLERHVKGFATDTQRHSDAPWWLYLPVLLGGSLPWIGYLPITIKEIFSKSEPKVLSPRLETPENPTIPADKLNSSTSSSTCILWCWLIASTILLSIAQSKLVTYIWPVFPTIAILAAIGWAKLLQGTLSPAMKESLRKNFLWSSLAGPLVLPIITLVLQIVFDIRFGVPAWCAAILVGLTSLLPIPLLLRGKWNLVLALSTLTTAVQFFTVMAFLVPQVAELYSQRQLAEYFNEHPGQLPKKLTFVEERVCSIVFYLKPDLRASLTKGQFERFERPKKNAMQKIDLKPGEAILMPAERENRAKQYLDLQNLDRQPVGRYLLYRFQIKPALRKPIDPSG